MLEENEGLIYLLLPFTYCLKKNGCISGNVLGRCSLSSVQLTPPEDASSKTVGALQYLEEVTLWTSQVLINNFPYGIWVKLLKT